MNERDTLAALLHDEQHVSFCGADPGACVGPPFYRPVADRLIAAGVRIAPMSIDVEFDIERLGEVIHSRNDHDGEVCDGCWAMARRLNEQRRYFIAAGVRLAPAPSSTSHVVVNGETDWRASYFALADLCKAEVEELRKDYRIRLNAAIRRVRRESAPADTGLLEAAQAIVDEWNESLRLWLAAGEEEGDDGPAMSAIRDPDREARRVANEAALRAAVERARVGRRLLDLASPTGDG